MLVSFCVVGSIWACASFWSTPRVCPSRRSFASAAQCTKTPKDRVVWPEHVVGFFMGRSVMDIGVGLLCTCTHGRFFVQQANGMFMLWLILESGFIGLSMRNMMLKARPP